MGRKRRSPFRCYFTRYMLHCEHGTEDVPTAIDSTRRPHKPTCWRGRSAVRVSSTTGRCACGRDAYYERQQRIELRGHLGGADRAEARAGDGVAQRGLQRARRSRRLRHLDRAFRNFFEGRAKYPAFHKKHGPQAAEYTTSAFRWNADTSGLTLAKMDAAARHPLVASLARWRHAEHRHRQPRYRRTLLRQHPRGRGHPALAARRARRRSRPWACTTWWCSTPARRWAIPSSSAATSSASPRRSVVWPASRKAPRTARRPASKVARIHARIADRRRDFLHKLSTRIIRENQTICVESLRVKAMVKTSARWRRPSTMSAGGSSCANWPTKPSGTGGRWSPSTSGIRAASAAPPAGMCSTRLPWRRASGRVLPAALSTTAT